VSVAGRSWDAESGGHGEVDSGHLDEIGGFCSEDYAPDICGGIESYDLDRVHRPDSLVLVSAAQRRSIVPVTNIDAAEPILLLEKS